MADIVKPMENNEIKMVQQQTNFERENSTMLVHEEILAMVGGSANQIGG